jgi:uncharacterized membrane protein
MWTMELFQAASLITATIAVGLTAGLLFAFATSVMPGLGRTDDRTFVGAFQALDRAIINPLFLVVFVGAVVLPAAAAALHLGADQRSVLPWALAGFVLSLATLVITQAVHLPLNAALQAAGEPDSIGDLAAVRARFEARWIRWHLVRTLTSTAALACLTLALISS